MGRDISYDEEAAEGIKEGMNRLADAVGVTLGPKGRNVVVERLFNTPQITKDGATVARDLGFDEWLENIGAQIVQQAATKTADNAGDGTTTSTLLTRDMTNKAYKKVAAGFSAQEIRKGMDLAMKEALSYLQYLSRDVETLEEIKWVANISSNGDEALAEIISEAMKKVGKGGVISVEESKSTKTHLDFVEGMQLDRGYVSENFMEGDEDQLAEVRLDDPLVLVADRKLSNPQNIIPAMEYAQEQGRPLFVIAHDIEGEALTMLVTNNRKKTVPSCAVKAPRIGDKRRQIIEDLAVLTGGLMISPQKGIKFDNTDPERYLGACESVSVDKDTTTIVNGYGDEEDISDRIEDLRTHARKAASPHDKETIQQRISQLGGGMALIRVGAETEVELKEYKARVEDALSATRAAVRRGIVPGGGCTFLEMSSVLRILLQEENPCANEEQEEGWKIVTESLESPFKTIMDNAGMEPLPLMDDYRKEAQKQDSPDLVMDVRDGEIKNAFDTGIVDPTMVLHEALKNSVSSAKTLITTSVAISQGEEPE